MCIVILGILIMWIIVQIEIMGRQKLAKILTKPIFDSNNSKMRN